MPKMLSKQIVNLHNYPTISPDIQDQITIGDLHGNALKLLHLLIQEGIFLMTPAQYQEFVMLYQIPADEISIAQLEKLENLIKNLQTPHPEIFIRLIGDERFDRGNNDYFIDLILKKMHNSHISYEILLSNHGARSIKQMESLHLSTSFYDDFEELKLQLLTLTVEDLTDQLNDQEIEILDELDTYEPTSLAHLLFEYQSHRLSVLYKNYIIGSGVNTPKPPIDSSVFNACSVHALENDPTLLPFIEKLNIQFADYIELAQTKMAQNSYILFINQKKSFKNLTILLNRKLVDLILIQDMYERYYTPYLKLLSYSLDPKSQTITIYSHAPCGINSIEQIAELFKIPFSNANMNALAHTIDKINDCFKTEYVKQHRIHSLLSSEEENKNSVIFDFIWNRNYCTINRPASVFDYMIHYVHGHDHSEKQPDIHIFSLDSHLGSITLVNLNYEMIADGEDLVLKGIDEFSLQQITKRYQNEFLSQIQKLSKNTLKRKSEPATEDMSAYQAIFNQIHEYFQQYVRKDCSFKQFIKHFCEFMTNSSPRMKLEDIKLLIETLHHLNSIQPSSEEVSFSMFAASVYIPSVKEQLEELEEYLSIQPTSVIGNTK